MAKTEEGKLKSICREYLKTIGWQYYSIIQWKYSVKGQPDAYAFKNGEIIFLEYKSKNGKQSAEQKEFQRICDAHNMTYILVYDLSDIINKLLEEL